MRGAKQTDEKVKISLRLSCAERWCVGGLGLRPSVADESDWALQPRVDACSGSVCAVARHPAAVLVQKLDSACGSRPARGWNDGSKTRPL